MAVLIAAVLLVALLTYGVLTQGQDLTLDKAIASGAKPAAPAGDLELPRLGGGAAVRLGDLRGEYVLLNIWASWCDPCRAEAPLLRRAQQRLQRARAGTVLGVTYQDTSRDSSAFARRYGLDFPIARDVGKKLAEAFGTRGIPETFLIDPRGRVVQVRRGALDARSLQQLMRAAGA